MDGCRWASSPKEYAENLAAMVALLCVGVFFMLVAVTYALIGIIPERVWEAPR